MAEVIDHNDSNDVHDVPFSEPTSDTRYSSAAIVAVTEVSEGEYEVSQVEGQDRIPKTPNAGGAIFPVGPVSIGPLKLSGQIDTTNLSAQLEVSVFGFKIGSFRGSLKDGIRIRVNLIVAKGSLRFYLKNGKELWVDVDLKVPFGKGVKISQKIATLPI